MASQTTLAFGFLAVLVMLAGVLGSVKRRERYAYVLGVALLLVGLTLAAAPRALRLVVVLGGFVAIGASVVPLLRE